MSAQPIDDVVRDGQPLADHLGGADPAGVAAAAHDIRRAEYGVFAMINSH